MARGLLARSILSLALVAGTSSLLASCSTSPHAWYRIDDYPAFTLDPILNFEDAVAQTDSNQGAPERMIKFNDQLQVKCSYCHLEGDPRDAGLTPAGTLSRLMEDLADRFKVECTYCHNGSPDQYTQAGKFALRDIHIPERRWKCAKCHDIGFKVTRTKGA
jgi:hypothetical protein